MAENAEVFVELVRSYTDHMPPDYRAEEDDG